MKWLKRLFAILIYRAFEYYYVPLPGEKLLYRNRVDVYRVGNVEICELGITNKRLFFVQYVTMGVKTKNIFPKDILYSKLASLSTWDIVNTKSTVPSTNPAMAALRTLDWIGRVAQEKQCVEMQYTFEDGWTDTIRIVPTNTTEEELEKLYKLLPKGIENI
ncbi:MAG: hypothetical protein Q7S61_05640 [bacterium]|nr:hypothetical protein [bacterium]